MLFSPQQGLVAGILRSHGSSVFQVSSYGSEPDFARRCFSVVLRRHGRSDHSRLFMWVRVLFGHVACVSWEILCTRLHSRSRTRHTVCGEPMWLALPYSLQLTIFHFPRWSRAKTRQVSGVRGLSRALSIWVSSSSLFRSHPPRFRVVCDVVTVAYPKYAGG